MGQCVLLENSNLTYPQPSVCHFVEQNGKPLLLISPLNLFPEELNLIPDHRDILQSVIIRKKPQKAESIANFCLSESFLIQNVGAWYTTSIMLPRLTYPDKWKCFATGRRKKNRKMLIDSNESILVVNHCISCARFLIEEF